MDNSQEYLLGQLSGNVKGLTEALRSVQFDIKALRDAVDSIRLWRAQVIGMAIAVSIAASVAVNALSLWSK